MEKKNPTLKMTSQSIYDELGRKKTLLQGNFAYILLDVNNLNSLYARSQNAFTCTKKQILILGLGANLHDILPYLEKKEKIFYLEHEAFSKQVSYERPKNFTPLTKEQIFELCDEDFICQTDILLYKQNVQLFPSFWNSVLITLRNKLLLSTYSQPVSKEKYIYLSGGKNDLLHKELCQAIHDMGAVPVEIGGKTLQEILELIDTKPPQLYLAINAQSLNGNGILYEQLKQKNIPLALWFVDNVWNILSGFSQSWWKECSLFLTDFSFARELQKEGAKRVFPLPLASHAIPANYQNIPEIPLLFVGNSSFANKNAYFSGCKLEHDFEQNLYRTIKKNLFERKSLPDFHTIHGQVLPNEPLWQNKQSRTIGYATTKADLYLRKLWLENLSPLIQIMGDNAWQDILSTPHTFYKPVDYYSTLPTYYKSSLFTLNLTSLLMPANLSQRHFDVWKHQGFLLSSPSKGMEIFPQDMQAMITVTNPQDCLNRLELLLTKPALKTEIQQAMQNEIAQKHKYTHRLQFMLKHC